MVKVSVLCVRCWCWCCLLLLLPLLFSAWTATHERFPYANVWDNIRSVRIRYVKNQMLEKRQNCRTDERYDDWIKIVLHIDEGTFLFFYAWRLCILGGYYRTTSVCSCIWISVRWWCWLCVGRAVSLVQQHIRTHIGNLNHFHFVHSIISRIKYNPYLTPLPFAERDVLRAVEMVHTVFLAPYLCYA